MNAYFAGGYISEAAVMLFGVEDMPVTLIVKPYKMFAKATIRLCLLFSLLVFLSFNLLFVAFLFAVYAVLFYFTNIFMILCVNFGYKRIMLILVFTLLYFLCFIGATNLRHFIADFIF